MSPLDTATDQTEIFVQASSQDNIYSADGLTRRRLGSGARPFFPASAGRRRPSPGRVSLAPARAGASPGLRNPRQGILRSARGHETSGKTDASRTLSLIGLPVLILFRLLLLWVQPPFLLVEGGPHDCPRPVFRLVPDFY